MSLSENFRARFVADQPWTSWSQLVSVIRVFTVRPRTEEEVVDTVRHATVNHRCARWAPATHGPDFAPPPAYPSTCLLSRV